MRIIQNYYLSSGTYNSCGLKKLIASVIQWKSVFSEDHVILYTNSWTLNSLKKVVENLPWDSISVIDLPKIGRFYDSSRFQICTFQEEPFIFLDPDVFVFREILQNSEFMRFRAELLDGHEHFISYLGPFPVRAYTEEEKSILEKYTRVPVGGLQINTGFFMATPKIAEQVSGAVLELQTQCQSFYSSAIHEYCSGAMPLIVLKDKGVKLDYFDSAFCLIHTCGCYFVSNCVSVQDREFYNGKDGYWDQFEARQYRRVAYWMDFCKKVLEQKYVSFEEAKLLGSSVRHKLSNKLFNLI